MIHARCTECGHLPDRLTKEFLDNNGRSGERTRRTHGHDETGLEKQRDHVVLAVLRGLEDHLLKQATSVVAQTTAEVALYILNQKRESLAQIELRYGVKVIMHRASEAPYIDIRVDDGDPVRFDQLALKVLATPGHTQDAMCLLFDDRIFTGDTLLIGGCGRTDLPGGDAEKQYESLQKLQALGAPSSGTPPVPVGATAAPAARLDRNTRGSAPLETA